MTIFVAPDAADRQGHEIWPEKRAYVVGDYVQFAVVTPVEKTAEAALLAAQSLVSLQGEKGPRADPANPNQGAIAKVFRW